METVSLVSLVPCVVPLVPCVVSLVSLVYVKSDLSPSRVVRGGVPRGLAARTLQASVSVFTRGWSVAHPRPAALAHHPPTLLGRMSPKGQGLFFASGTGPSAVGWRPTAVNRSSSSISVGALVDPPVWDMFFSWP